jgi:pyruvate dehydrogenase E2 component (dihydrolipoyllysine-residue acetyltransferase)
MAEFVMPILGADMTAGTLVAWRKRLGDRVQRGDIIAEVETEKGLIEVEVFTTGVIEKILIAPGTEVPVGTVLALIREDGAPAPARREVAPAVEAGRLRISPAARRRAAELGVDPATVHGTGPDDAITREDIERAVTPPQAPSPVPPAAALDRFARLRQTIAAAMARSKREIPHYYVSTTVDMHRAMTWLAEANRTRSVVDRLLPAVLLIKAVALALREVPELNAEWVNGQTVPSESIHVGVAISLRQGGLVSPALHHTDRQGLDDLMRNLRDLVKRARAGSLRSSELSDPTITVTNIGEQGVESVFGIIYPPQTAIVGFGKIVARPWSVDGEIVSRPVVTATLSADHRVTDGHRGALLLAAVDRLLQEPGHL